MKRLLSCFILITAIVSAEAQELNKPRSVLAAYQKGTRSDDGKPGKNYWQNYGRYDISLMVSPPDRTILGTEQITYANKSPDTLKYLVIKLICNIHKPDALRVIPMPPEYLTTGIHIDSLSVNETPHTWQESTESNTNVFVKLDHPLPANDSVRLYIQWHYDVSKKGFREGMADSTTYFLAYFYPRVAVYDDCQGWDTDEFDDFHEFYNDFNDYKLNVQVPENFLVWATGTLLNVDDVLQSSFAEKFRLSMESDSLFHIVTKQDLATKNITAHHAVNNWLFTARNISDIALCLSDHYIWDATSVVVDTASKRRASIQAVFNDTAADFHYVARFSRDALWWLSRKCPGIPYPFEKTIVFQGSGDMEYPMMVNDESFPDTIWTRFITFHEIAHSYLPFYLGINETRYGFMDEGWTTALELPMLRNFLGYEKGDDFFTSFRVNPWIKDPLSEDIPVIIPGISLKGFWTMVNNQYGKPSLCFLALKDMLGDVVFKQCTHEFFKRWNGKHPLPWDLFYTFNEVSGENLNWFWNNWLYTFFYIDLSVSKVEKIKGGYNVYIDNTGGMAVPFDATITYADNSSETIHQTPAVWRENEKQSKVEIKTSKAVQSVKINGGIFVDAKENDNNWIIK